MRAERITVGSVAAACLVVLVGLALVRVVSGTDPSDTLLFWLGTRPNLFVGLIVGTVVAGTVLELSKR